MKFKDFIFYSNSSKSSYPSPYLKLIFIFFIIGIGALFLLIQLTNKFIDKDQFNKVSKNQITTHSPSEINRYTKKNSLDSKNSFHSMNSFNANLQSKNSNQLSDNNVTNTIKTNSQSDSESENHTHTQTPSHLFDNEMNFETPSPIYSSLMNTVDKVITQLNSIPATYHSAKLDKITDLKNQIQKQRSLAPRQVEGEELSFDLLDQGLELIINSPNTLTPKKCSLLKQQFLMEFSPKFELDFEFEGTKKAYTILQALCH